MFTAIAEMDRVLKVENEVAQDLRNYVIQEEKRLDHLKKYNCLIKIIIYNSIKHCKIN